MADAEFRARVSVTGAEEAASQLEKIAEAGEGLDGEQIQADVDVDTAEAEAGIGTVAENLAEVDGTSATADVTVDADTAELDTAAGQLEGIDGTTATADVTVDADTTAVDEAAGTLDQLDGSTVTATAAVDADTAALDDVTAGLDEVDGTSATATVTVEGDTGPIEEVAAGLAEIDGSTATASIEVNTEGAQAGIGGLGASLGGLGAALGGMGGAAGGAAGKLGGLTSVMGKAGPVGMAVAAGIAAIGAVAGSSSDKFQQLAEQMRQLSGRAAVGIEDMSRLTAVADDFNVPAEAMAQSLFMMNQRMDPAVWREYGIAAEDAHGNLLPVPDLLANVLGGLTAIEDPQERLQVGTELLGRGYRNLTPMLGESADAYREMFGAVEDGQVITAEEAEKAEEMRVAQDALSDAFGELELAVGEVVAEFAPFIHGLATIVGMVGEAAAAVADAVGPFVEFGAKIVDVMGTVSGAIGDVSGALVDMANTAVGPLERVGNMFGGSGGFVESIRAAQTEASILGPAMADTTTALELMGQVGGEAALAAEGLAATERFLAEMADIAAEAERALAEELQNQVDALNESAAATQARSNSMRAAADADYALTQAQVGLNEAVAGFDQAMLDAEGDILAQREIMRGLANEAANLADAEVRVAEETAAAAGATLTAAQRIDTFNHSLLTSAANLSGPMRQSLLDYIARVNGIAPERVTEISALLDAGDVAGAEAALAELSHARSLNVSADMDTAAATEQADALAAYVEGEPLVATIDGDTRPVEDDIEEVTDAAYMGTVTLEGDTAPADTAIAQTEDAAYLATIAAEGDTETADADLLAVAAAPRNALIFAVAKTEVAKIALDLLDDPRDIPLDAWLRTWPTAQDIINRIGPVRVPIDVVIGSTPRITGERGG